MSKTVCTYLFPVLLLIGLVAYVWHQAVFFTDSVGYIAAALQHIEKDPQALQAKLFRVVDNEIPAAQVSIMNEFKWFQNLRIDPDAISKSLPYLNVKPLYVWTIAGLHAVGVKYTSALRLINTLSCAVTLWVLFLWIGRYGGAAFASLATLSIFWLPYVSFPFKLMTPDASAACLAVAGMYLAFERRLIPVGLGFLVIATLVRPDYLLLGFLVVAALAWAGGQAVSKPVLALALFSDSCAYLVANRGAYPWRMLIEISCFDGQAFTTSDYLRTVATQFFIAISNDLSILLFLSVVALLSRRLTRMQLGCAAVQLACISRLLLFPRMEWRFFLPQYLIVATLTAVALSPPRAKPEPSSTPLPPAGLY